MVFVVTACVVASVVVVGYIVVPADSVVVAAGYVIRNVATIEIYNIN